VNSRRVMADPATRHFNRTEEMADAIRAMVATVGLFDPLKLVPKSVGSEERADILTLLARDCQEERYGRLVLWNLGMDARRREFARLAGGDTRARERPRVGGTLLPSVRPIDPFGKFLHRLVTKRKPIDLAPSASPSEIKPLLTAYDLAREIVPEFEKQWTKLRAQLLRATSEESLKTVAPAVLFGREKQLGVLADYALTGRVPPDCWPFEKTSGDPDLPPEKRARRPPAKTSRLQGVVVHGVGGVGKSALAAKLVLQLRKNWNGQIVIILDFDSPAISAADPIEMLFEFTRQIATALPELAERATRFRANARTILDAQTKSTSSMEFNISVNLLSGLLVELREKVVGAATLTKVPVIIVLDAFEEILVRGDIFAKSVFSWLEAMRDEVGIPKLRTVVSGRAAPYDAAPMTSAPDMETVWSTAVGGDEVSLDERVCGEIVLGDIDYEAAVALLSAHGVAKVDARRAAEIYGGNPLVLLILAQIYKRRRGEFRKLLKESGGDKTLKGEMAQRFLYSRILMRIKNEKVRRLAYPGLVLRRVTPRLIERVLAEPCRLGTIDTTEAEKLFKILSREVWLVRPGDVRSVWHRRDLRRLMLPLIAGNNQEMAAEPYGLFADISDQDKQEIHRRAVEYYEEGEEPGLLREDSEIEALYHRLFLPELPPSLTPEIARSAYIKLGADIDDLPIRSRGLIKYHAEFADRLTKAELATLPGEARFDARSKRSKSARVLGGTLEFFYEEDPANAERPASPTPVIGREPRTPEEILDLFEQARFEDVVAEAPRVFGAMPGSESPYRYPFRTEPTQSHWWRIAMANLVVPWPDATAWGAIDRAMGEFRHGLWIVNDDIPQELLFNFMLPFGGAALIAYGRAGGPPPPFDSRFRTLLEELGTSSQTLNQVRLRVDSNWKLRCLQLLLTHDIWPREWINEITVQAQWLKWLDPIYAPTRLTEMPSPPPAGWGLFTEGVQTFQRILSPIRQEILTSVGSSGHKRRKPSLSAIVEAELIAAKEHLVFWPDPRPNFGRDTVLLRALRGVTPELHGLIRTLLNLSKMRPDAIAAVAQQLSEHAVAWPRELQGRTFESNLARDRNRWIATLISAADLRGLLRDLLLAFAQKISPPDRRWSNTIALYNHYDRLLVGTDDIQRDERSNGVRQQ
jgi:hypothetical protein